MPAVDSFDLRYHQTWRVGRSGEGFIQVHEHEDQNMQEDDDSPQDGDGATRSGARRRDTVERDVLEKLINYYFKHIAPMFPVITEQEFLYGIEEEEEPASPSRLNGFSHQPERQASSKHDDRLGHTYKPPPVLLYAICTISATARHVPSRVFDSLRFMLNSVIRSEDVMSTASLSNIQALLIAGMTAEAHGRAPGQAMSAAWLRVSAATRMAQDLGLHRAEAVKANIQLRRRLWAACVISDRWFALTLGLPFIIDVHDCDARLPGPDVLSAHADEPMTQGHAIEAKSLLFMSEFVKLSVLCGKVVKTIYGPTGLIHTTDEILERLQDELEKFIPNLPSELVFRGKDSDVFAGLIQLCHCCIGLMFWRVFARIQYTMPVHLKFAITVEAWTALTIESAKAIEWLDHHETLYDSWFIVGYSLTSCALVQYHTWARRSDDGAQTSLKQARDCAKRWDRAVDAGHMLTRRKTTEIISLLYEATQNPVPRNFWPLNPTAGVEARNSASADAIVFRKDPMRPGGGLFLATSQTADALGEDMPSGTLVLPDPLDVYVSPTGGVPGQDAGETARAGPNGPGWAGEANGMPRLPPVPHSMSMSVGERDTSSTMSNVNPNMPSGDTPYDVQMLNTLQDQPADPASSYGAGGFVVPIPNYQHPYYVPDYNLPPPPPLPRLHGRRD